MRKQPEEKKKYHPFGPLGSRIGSDGEGTSLMAG